MSFPAVRSAINLLIAGSFMNILKDITTELTATSFALFERPACATTTSASCGIRFTGECSIFTSKPAFFAYFIIPFFTIKLEPMPASHAKTIFLTSLAGIESLLI